jgi:hypothetical protein
LAGGLLRLQAGPTTQTLATLALPYGHPQTGSVLDQEWASIHSFPPWEDTGKPILVESSFGSGRAVYSAFDIEREEADVNDRLFEGLIVNLLGDDWSFWCDLHPAVCVSAFRDSEAQTIRVSLLNYPPALVPQATLRLRAPNGCRFVGLTEIPSNNSVPFQTASDGTLQCTCRPSELAMLLAHYALA